LLRLKRLTAVFPAKAGTQIHQEPLVGFTWAPTFVGEADKWIPRFNSEKSRP
jgi:hypothetical protein